MDAKCIKLHVATMTETSISSDISWIGPERHLKCRKKIVSHEEFLSRFCVQDYFLLLLFLWH